MKFLFAILIFYAAFCVFVFVYQKRLLFFPDLASFDHCPGVKAAGGEAIERGGARYYFIPTDNKNPKGVILHFHGNGGRACDRYPYLKNLNEMGYHLALAEYPGYAEEAPLPSEDEIMRSGQAVFESVQKRDSKLPVILFGESLGGAPAVWLAARNSGVKALVLQTPFPSIAAVGQIHYPYLPVKLLLRDKYGAGEWAKKTNVPVFVFHGTKDGIIPLKLGREQFENFPSAEKEFFKVSKAGHNDILLVAGEELWEKIKSFLND